MQLLLAYGFNCGFLLCDTFEFNCIINSFQIKVGTEEKFIQ